MAHDGVMLAGEMDEDSLSHEAAATDTLRRSRLVPAKLSFVWRPGYAPLCGGVSSADDMVGS